MITQYLRIALVAVAFAAPSQTLAEQAFSPWAGTFIGLGASSLELDTLQYSAAQGAAPLYLKGAYGGGHRHGFIQGAVRRQSGNIVWGLRLRHQQTGSEADAFVNLDETVSANLKSLTSLSATLGYVVQPKLMVYATAGAAHGRFDYGSVDYEWEQVDYSEKGSRNGLTFGFGAEYQLSDRVSIFSEYSHTRFATNTITFIYPPPSVTEQWTYDYDHEFGEISLGMNFRF